MRFLLSSSPRGVRAALLCVVLASVVVSLRAESSATQKEILHLEDVLTKAWLERDVSTISPLIAEDYQDWSDRGVRLGKADLLKAVQKNAGSTTHVEEPAVRVYGDTAIFTARVIETRKPETGKPSRGQGAIVVTCITDVFVRRNGRWVVVTSQETLIPNH